MTLKLINVEQWRPVPGFPKYEVSSLGRVRSTTTSGKRKLLKPWLSGKGPAKYLCVGLSEYGHMVRRLVHQLVLEAFVGPRPKGLVSRHLDGNRLNCSVSNLTRGTPKENMADRRKHGHGNDGERNPKAKLTFTQVLEIRRRAWTKSEMKQEATDLGVRPTTIQNIVSGKSWR